MTPTLIASADGHPPSVTPSPKRKRSDSVDPATTAALSTFAPRLKSGIAALDRDSGLASESIPTPNSPRSIVASQLSDLRIKELDPTNLPAVEFGVSDKTSKRMKRALVPDNAKTQGNSIESIREVPETAQEALDKSEILARIERDPNSSPTPASRPRRNSSPPPPISELVWQDSEITGHIMADPDDDGTGINGIGFKPTPAIAYAREQRRKQQVHEWKQREAREARQRRSERRRGAAAAEDRKAAEGAIRRMVRFADALKA